MEFETLNELNNRSKKLNGPCNCIFLKGFRRLNKKNSEDLATLQSITEALEEELPEETYGCEFECMNNQFVFNFWSDFLISSLVDRIIAGEVWVANPEFIEESVLSSVEILPAYTKLQMELSENDMVATVYVDSIRVASLCLPELIGEDAADEIYNRAITNLRKYGFATKNVENKLLNEIKRCLNNDVKKVVKGIELGIDFD